MPVNVIGTLKPKNNGKFPVAEAVDIKVTDDLRLDEALENKADLATVNFALAGKANASDFATSTANLQGQINQIVISSSAESVVAPEVSAARVDASGIEFSTLKDRLDKHDTIRSELFDGIIVSEDTYINHSTGRTETVSVYFATDYIPLTYPISVRTKVGNDTSGIAFYSADKTFISGYNPYSDNETEVLLNPPTGAAYVRVSCLDAYRSKFICRYNKALSTIESKISALNADISSTNARIDNFIKAEYDVIASSYVIARNGSQASVSVYFSTDYIPLTYPIIVKTKVGDDLSGICFYNENKKFISGYNPFSDNEMEVTLQPPEGAVYVRISCLTSYADSFVCKYDDVLESIKENITEIKEFISVNRDNIAPTFWAQAMWKVLCIGDSLTSGANYNEEWGEQTSPGASIDQNYPRMLGRLICGETTNAGFSGYSASTWWNSQKDSYQFNDYDTFIIWLGTNNGLTDTLDTDVDPYEDYNDFAETETGYYCKIIEKIKEENESCLIVLTKVFASKGSVSETNTAIDHIAEKYNLPVIDNSDLGTENRPELHGGITNPHFGKAGNAYVANRYISELGKWFAENPLRCEFHYTARTN